MERDDRAVASFFVDAALTAGTTAALDERVAHHVRVKRMEVGDRVRLTDGKGTLAFGSLATLDRRVAEVAVERTEVVPPLSPLHLRVPVADRDRLLWLAEKATELGITTWQLVHFRRSASVSPRGEGSAFAEKVRARMISAVEQSGSAWLPTFLPDATVASLAVGDGELGVLLDVEGAPLASVAGASGDRATVLLFGPEGGIEAAEREKLIAAGWRPARIGTSTLRFETAGVAAVAVCRSLTLDP